MARLIRPLRQFPQLQHWRSSYATLDFPVFLSVPLTVATKATSLSYSFATATSSRRTVRHRARGLRVPDAPPPSQISDQEEDRSDSDSDAKKSRNQKKREARRAVRWGMDLAPFSTAQIKRILRAASVEEDVLEALMLVKRLGPDVREGKRRQFSYIGKLLRDAEPELMDTLIQATKVGDQDTLQRFDRLQPQIMEDDDEESEAEDEDEGSQAHTDIASRWFEGLISKDITITNEVYSINAVDFDRQELRKLVRRLQTMKDQRQVVAEDEEENDGAKIDAAVMGAEKSLTRFLKALAKQLPSE